MVDILTAVVAVVGRPQHLDEKARPAPGAALAGPVLACGCKPGIETPDIVPIGNRNHVGEAAWSMYCARSQWGGPLLPSNRSASCARAAVTDSEGIDRC